MGTRVASAGDAGPEALEHDVVWPVTYPMEWLPEMLRTAGCLIVDLNLQLLDAGFVLQDGTPRNVVFAGARPVFVDFTSIVPAPSVPLWLAYDQFAREVLYPLYLSSWALTPVWRHAALSQPRRGVTARHLCNVMPTAFRLRHPLKALRLTGMARLEHLHGRHSHALVAHAASLEARTGLFLARFFARLGAELDGFARTIQHPGDGWHDYYDRCADTEVTARKAEAVAAVLDRSSPATVLDLGANTGRFSLMAAERGARVVAVDVDERALSVLLRETRRRQLAVTPVVMDAACPSPQFGLGAAEFPSATERFAADVTLALGLAHHLVARNDYTLDRLVACLASYRSRLLLLEFVGAEDPRAEAVGLRRRGGYTLERCRAAIGRHYSGVESVEIAAARWLMVGENKQ